MFGTIAINFWLGIIAFFITFFTALLRNIFLVSLERAVYAFILFFILAFAMRWVLKIILADTQTKTSDGSPGSIQRDIAEGETGQHIDLVTPDETEFPVASQEEIHKEDFVPLSAPRVEIKTPHQNPETIAEMVRRRLQDE